MEERTLVKTSEFLEEKIKTRPANRRRIMRRAIEVAILAVLFGLVACVTMATVSPILEEKLFQTPTNEVTFPEESTIYTSEEVQPEDMLLEDKEEVPSIVVEEPDSETQLLEMIYLLKEKAEECKKWMVQVNGVSNTVSWLDSTDTSSNVATGAIVADNGTEILILVERDCLLNADKIEVTFVDNSVAEGYQKGEDLDAGLSVVAIPKEAIAENTLENCKLVEMTSSNNKAIVGSVVMAMGSPNGVNGSVSYGFVTANGVEVNGWDTNYRLVLTDMYGVKNPNGFLVNLKGQMVGVLCNDYNDPQNENMTAALGISELRKKIERMSNAEGALLFGVKAKDVTTAAHEEHGIPYGAYVLGVKLDSPAMQAGIQAGDVIIKVGAKDISSMNSLSYHLHQLEIGDAVDVVIMRQSQGTYKESVLNIVLGNQN